MCVCVYSPGDGVKICQIGGAFPAIGVFGENEMLGRSRGPRGSRGSGRPRGPRRSWRGRRFGGPYRLQWLRRGACGRGGDERGGGGSPRRGRGGSGGHRVGQRGGRQRGRQRGWEHEVDVTLAGAQLDARGGD